MPAGLCVDDSRSTVIASLRRATAAQHRDLEALLPLDERLTRSSYLQVIRGFDLFLASWEPRLQQALPAGLRPWAAGRSRHALLRRDLQALAAPPATGSPDALDSLSLPSKAAAFGSLYVMEGSMLGGQVIALRLAQALALGPENGAAYLSGWGAATGTMWREFRQRLEHEVGSCALAREQACTAAAQTFAALAATFRGVLHDGAAA